MARTRSIVGGVDTHADIHHNAVIDDRGWLLDTAEFPATGAGYEQTVSWMRGLGQLSRVGVEGTGSYGAGLARAAYTAIQLDLTNLAKQTPQVA